MVGMIIISFSFGMTNIIVGLHCKNIIIHIHALDQKCFISCQFCGLNYLITHKHYMFAQPLTKNSELLITQISVRNAYHNPLIEL